jgi:regulatory protein
LLSYRARTREELRRRLLAKRYEPSAVDDELARLVALGYLDDSAFARSWVAERQAGSAAHGSLALRSQLRVRGVEREIVESALRPEDDAGAAAQAAAKRARLLAGLPKAAFERRLGAFLQRRGFDAETVRRTVTQAWRAAGRTSIEDADAG